MNILNNLNAKTVNYLLRIAIFGEFLGHGVFALQGKKQWVDWFIKLLGVDQSLAVKALLVIGIFDIALALLVLIKPLKPALLWMAFWGFFTALIRPIVGESFWDFVERWANWGAPIALLYISKKSKE